MTIHWKQAAVVFALGLVVGGALGSWGQRAVLRRFMRGGPPPVRMLDKMSRELGLDERQKEAVKAVFDAHGEEIRVLHRQTRDRMDSMRKGIRGELAKVLTPEQLAKFDVVVARKEARMKRPRGGGRPEEGLSPGGPPRGDR